MGSDFGEDRGVGIPHSDAAVVFATLLIIDDEGHDLMSQAFFHHNQPAEAAIAVFKGMDAFKAHMEIQDILQCDIALRLVFLQRALSSFWISFGGVPYL